MNPPSLTLGSWGPRFLRFSTALDICSIGPCSALRLLLSSSPWCPASALAAEHLGAAGTGPATAQRSERAHERRHRGTQSRNRDSIFVAFILLLAVWKDDSPTIFAKLCLLGFWGNSTIEVFNQDLNHLTLIMLIMQDNNQLQFHRIFFFHFSQIEVTDDFSITLFYEIMIRLMYSFEFQWHSHFVFENVDFELENCCKPYMAWGLWIMNLIYIILSIMQNSCKMTIYIVTREACLGPYQAYRAAALKIWLTWSLTEFPFRIVRFIIILEQLPTLLSRWRSCVVMRSIYTSILELMRVK